MNVTLMTGHILYLNCFLLVFQQAAEEREYIMLLSFVSIITKVLNVYFIYISKKICVVDKISILIMFNSLF